MPEGQEKVSGYLPLVIFLETSTTYLISCLAISLSFTYVFSIALISTTKSSISSRQQTRVHLIIRLAIPNSPLSKSRKSSFDLATHPTLLSGHCFYSVTSH